MIGTLTIWIAFAAALISAWSYFQVATKKREVLKLARRSFHVMVLGVMVSSFLLLMFILQHRFEYAYIYGYSSKDLPLHLLITTFWAGQEGSFLFWILCGSIIGVFLLNYNSRRCIEGEVMAVYVLVQ
ncbi:MAG: cytochrome C assembly protein, partial [Bacteroidota bacterium]